jgi:hypothetical protein
MFGIGPQTAPACDDTSLIIEPIAEQSPIPFDLTMYITLCKGTVYQSCGDDERSMICFLEGLKASRTRSQCDWEMISLNAIGILAFYNFRYDLAFGAFATVTKYRELVGSVTASRYTC